MIWKLNMTVKIKKLERHTVIYTDEYEMSDDEFKNLYSSKDDFLKKVQSEEIEEFKINSFVDDKKNTTMILPKISGEVVIFYQF